MSENYYHNEPFKAWWWGIKWAFLFCISGVILAYIVKLISKTMKHSDSRSLINAREDMAAKKIPSDLAGEKIYGYYGYHNALVSLQANLDRSWNEIKECLSPDAKMK